jgi:lysophospholipase L1-like esterase
MIESSKGGPMKWQWLWIAAIALLAIGSSPGRGQSFALHEGDRVVFYGDSITAQRLYTRFVEDFVLTRYPQLHITFWNAGIPGDTVYGGYTGDMPARLARDVAPHQPTVITIMLGMNDGYYMAFDQKYLDIYKDGYRKLLDAIRVQTPAARLTLISPTPYDEVTHGTEFAHYNEVVSRHAAFVKELAAGGHLGFSDFNLVETDLLDTGMRKNSSLTALLVVDRIHPAETSHWVMASSLMHSWGSSPIVSSLQLDGSTGKVSTSVNSQVTDLAVANGTMQWTQTDNALPLPLPLDDARMQFVLSISNLAEMDQQLLCVKNLPAPRYVLKIDDKRIDSFTREQLSSGINLALYSTPMESQAKGVDGIEEKRTRLDEARFLLTVEDPKAADAAEAVRGIEAKDAVLVEEQRKAAQPKPHHFELSPE